MQRSAGPASAAPRVVLDTNVVLSALLFRGPTGRLVDLWQAGRFVFLVSRRIVNEYLTTLGYQKFGLSDQEIRFLVEEQILPFVEVIQRTPLLKIPALQDVTDRKFVECAAAGRADFLVTGDAELLHLQDWQGCRIISPNLFLRLQPGQGP